MPTKATTKTLLANITEAARESVSTGESFTTVAEKYARLTGWLFAQCAVAYGKGVLAAEVATAATDGGYKCDDTTASKLVRAGRILLLDKPSHNADDALARGDEARKAVNNAVRYGIALADIDGIISAAPCADEALKSLTDAAKAAKAAKAAAKEAEEEAEAMSGANAPATTAGWLNTAAQNLMKAVTEGVLTSEHLPILRAIAETAGNAALLLEAGEPVAA